MWNMAVDLTPRTREVTVHLFGSANAPFVEELLVVECGANLPLYKPATPEGLERIRLAVLKISNGDQDKLFEAILLAKRDWRDVLVWADFANDLDAHTRWAKDLK
jgi:hypothetical protein